MLLERIRDGDEAARDRLLARYLTARLSPAGTRYETGTRTPEFGSPHLSVGGAIW